MCIRDSVMSEKVLCDCCCEREATARDSIVGANYSADCLNNYGTQRIMDRIQARRGLTECAACGAMHDRANGPTWTHSMDGVIYLTCGNCPLDGTSQRIRARLSAKRPSKENSKVCGEPLLGTDVECSLEHGHTGDHS